MNKELMISKTKIYKCQMQEAIDAWDKNNDESKYYNVYSKNDIECIKEIASITRKYMKQDIFTEEDFDYLDKLDSTARCMHLKHGAESTIKLGLTIGTIGLIGLIVILCLI